MEITPNPMKDYFLHKDSSGYFLNNTSPTAMEAKDKVSPSINRTTYKEIETWDFNWRFLSLTGRIYRSVQIRKASFGQKTPFLFHR
jgi:hypothetical protein